MARWLRRSAPASSPEALAVLAAIVLVGALVLTGRVLDGRGGGERRSASGAAPVSDAAVTTQAPYRVGREVGCPALWPVLAMSNHASYPAGHPARPPRGAAPVACFRTTGQAAGAGYAPAPLPAGALEVGGVYLTAPGRSFEASCRRVADRLGFAVPCPGLLPTAPPGSPPPRLCDQPGTCRRGQVLGFVQGAFVVPLGYVGAPGGFSALEVAATPAPGTSGGSVLRCRRERWIATPTVHGIRGVLAACLDDPRRSAFGGSVLLRWWERGTVVVVSVLDWSNASQWSDASRWSDVNQRLVVVLANHVRLVGPAR